jgi:hypothetical protein
MTLKTIAFLGSNLLFISSKGRIYNHVTHLCYNLCRPEEPQPPGILPPPENGEEPPENGEEPPENGDEGGDEGGDEAT